jgi:hypothetical protein
MEMDFPTFCSIVIPLLIGIGLFVLWFRSLQQARLEKTVLVGALVAKDHLASYQHHLEGAARFITMPERFYFQVEGYDIKNEVRCRTIEVDKVTYEKAKLGDEISIVEEPNDYNY